MTTQIYRAHADAYGVRVDMTIAVADNATEQELTRALQIATATAHAKHAEHNAQDAGAKYLDRLEAGTTNPKLLRAIADVRADQNPKHTADT